MAEIETTTSKAHGLKYVAGAKSSLQVLVQKPVEEIIAEIKYWAVEDPITAEDHVTGIRDILQYPKFADKAREILPLCIGIKELSSSCRILVAVTLYNLADLSLALDMFRELVVDQSMLLDDRVECAAFLYSTQESEPMMLAQDFLLDTVSSVAINGEYRMRIIMSYVNVDSKGLATKHNSYKLILPRDEDFLFTLLNEFSYNDQNPVENRLITVDGILSLSNIDDRDREKAIAFLFSVAENAANDENLRADAADIIIRRCEKEVERARVILGTMKTGETLYADKQNVHDKHIVESVNGFIVKLFSTTKAPELDYDHTRAKIASHLSLPAYTSKIRTLAHKGLSRIDVDAATFTELKVNMRDVLRYVWDIIEKSSHKDQLRVRLVEELAEMGGTCASGHYIRLINALAEYEAELKISWNTQITSNIDGRVNALMRDSPEEVREAIAIGIMPDAKPKEREEYEKHIISLVNKVYGEMRQEFVGGGYLSRDSFEMTFDASVEKLYKIQFRS